MPKRFVDCAGRTGVCVKNGRCWQSPLVIDPAGLDPVACDREHVVVLGDRMFANPYSVLAKLKKDEGYSNYRRRTVGDFFRAISMNGLGATVNDRLR